MLFYSGSPSRAVFVAAGVFAASFIPATASADVLITQQIEPNGWSGGPQPVALRCAGLINIINSQQPSMQALNAMMALLGEAERLGEGASTFKELKSEMEAYSQAYLALPQDEETASIVGLDMQSCMTFVQVIAGQNR
jgi:hypothetical protein